MMADDRGAVEVAPADPLGPAARNLVEEMVAEIPPRYGEVLDAAAAAARAAGVLAANAAFLGERSVFLVATAGGQAIGCGGIQPIAAGQHGHTGEVKRMYVTPGWRRRGVGAALLAALEARAQACGFRRLVLETGDRQPEAAALYTAGGWMRIAPFGPYADDPTSVCFEKWL